MVPGLLPHQDVKCIYETPGVIILNVPCRISRRPPRGCMPIMNAFLSMKEDIIVVLPDNVYRQRRDTIQILFCLDIPWIQRDGVKKIVK